jgi:hypothetical protein
VKEIILILSAAAFLTIMSCLAAAWVVHFGDKKQ